MSLKKLLFFVTFIMYCQLGFTQNNGKHEVMPGETLYSLSKRYNTTVDAIQKANGLTSDAIKAGQILIIPSATEKAKTAVPQQGATSPNNVVSKPVTAQPTVQTTPSQQEPAYRIATDMIHIPKCKLTYITEKKITIDDVCQKFSISVGELLENNPQLNPKKKIKKGSSICIPYSERERVALIQAETARMEEAQRKKAEEERARRLAEAERYRIPNINVALILPFELSQHEKSQEAIKMIDFYEGLLLAVADLKNSGANVSIDVYDEQEESIEEIISKISKKPCHLIIGAKNVDNINALRGYSKRNNTLLAVPFSSREDLTVGHPFVFQVNMKSSLLYNQIYQRFAEENRGSQVVFVTCTATDDNRYIDGFRQYLSEHSISHTSASIDNLSAVSALASSGKRVVLIPTSKSVDSFKEIVSVLDSYDSNVSSNISMFGYPEWQTFSTENTNKMRLYHCSFYTTFYANLSSSEVLNFTQRFKKEFKRDQYNSRPLYGLLGYDVTRYFIGGLNQFGTNFINSQDIYTVPALQNPMQFERNISSVNGFINKNIRIVHP